MTTRARLSGCRYNVSAVIARLVASLLLVNAVSFAAEVIDPAEVRPGDEGVCITEVENGALVEIPLRVLGVMGPNGPEREMVLVELEDERFEEVGVAAGMSGSPVYVGGRLLGALAFGWQFASQPIAGVTPFTRMQDLAAGDDHSSAGGDQSRPQLEMILQAHLEGRLPEVVLDWLAPDGGRRADALPLAVGGLGAAPDNHDWPAEAFRRMGWMASPVGGGATEENTGPISPGSMVAAVLVNGDAHLAAGGTVTEVDGDRVWAFGHPFLSGGAISLPLARASVVTILPSIASSFKMFNVGPLIGSLTVDRAHGVFGRLGDAPPMMPLEVRTPDAVYRFGVVDHDLLKPLLTGFMVYSSHAARGREFGLQTVDLELQVDFIGGRTIELEQSFQGGDAPAQCAAWISAVLGYLAASPFAPIDMQSVVVTLVGSNGLQGASILDIVPDRRVVAPGERLGIRVRLLRDGGMIETVDLEAVIPAETAAGQLDLVVADGASWTAYDLGMRPLKSASFEDELGLLETLESSQSIVVALEKQGASVVLPGGTVAAPPGVIAALQSGLGESLQTASYRLVSRSVFHTRGPVLGATRVRLEVRPRVEWDGVSQ